jgi:hypothetical protein
VVTGSDAEAVDAAVGAWLATRADIDIQAPADPDPPQHDDAPPRAVLAVDGKRIRGAVDDDGNAPHLLAAATHGQALVLAQIDVHHKTNEIPRFAPLLDTIDIAGMLITADALCRARHKASYVDPIVMPTGVGNCPRWWGWAARVVRHNRGILIL